MTLSPGHVLGSFFIGNTLTSILFGAITLQTRLYFTRFPSDSRILKFMVAFLWLAQLLEMMISSHKLYGQTTHSHQASSATSPPRSPTWEKDYWYTHTILSSFIVQSFFAYRLWSLSRYRIYIGMIVALIVVNFAVALSDNLDDYLGRPPEAAHDLDKVIIITTCSAVIDLAVAFGVVLILRKQRTGFVQTDRIVNWIILYGVASGVLTSIFALVILVLNLVGEANKAIGVAMSFGAVYIASALAHLHSRAGLRLELSGECRLPTRGPWISSTKISLPPPNSPSSRRSSELMPTPSPELLASQHSSYPTGDEADGVQVIIDSGYTMLSEVAIVGVKTSSSARQHAPNSTYDELEVSSLSHDRLTPNASMTPGSPLEFTPRPVSSALSYRAPPRFNPTELFGKDAPLARRTNSIPRNAS
ncbi:hypothetical protein DL93DRAFT_2230211 [Clavulina sp. PMI_390]|nr:hypothetical protein DL93DRAFT_2230211 [Clavulina sp. PMI_390]